MITKKILSLLKKCVRKNIMTAKLNEDIDFATGTATNKIALSEGVSIGDGLTLTEDGGIKIGPGISKVLVSGNLKIKNNNESSLGTYNAYVLKNNISTVVASGRNVSVAVGDIEGISISPALVDVEENDVIYLGFYKISSHLVSIGGTYSATYLTVVEID